MSTLDLYKSMLVETGDPIAAAAVTLAHVIDREQRGNVFFGSRKFCDAECARLAGKPKKVSEAA